MKRFFYLCALLTFSCFSLFADNLVVERNNYGVDHQLKVIVVHLDVSRVNAVQNLTSGFVLDRLYLLEKPISSFANGSSYTVVDDNSIEYKLYITQFPILNMAVDGQIVNTPAVHGIFNIVDSDGTSISMNMGIKIRGTSSQQYEKKSYRIEFWSDETGLTNADTTFLGLRSDDDWNLEAMYNQPLRLRNKFASELWCEIHQLAYLSSQPDAISGARMEYVDVFLNNSYIGIYALSERIDRKQLSLKKYNGDIRGELYKGNGEGAPTFTNLSPYDNDLDTWDNFEWVYPNESDSIINWDNLYSMVNFVMNSSDNAFYAQYPSIFELQNLVDYYLYINTIKAMDNMGRNVFIAKYSKSTPYFYVPWDMDACLGMDANASQVNYTGGLMSNALFDRLATDCEPNGFVNTLKDRYNDLRNNLLSKEYVMGKIQDIYDYLNENGAYARESEAWPEFSVDETELDRISTWLDNRFNFLDQTFNYDCGSWAVDNNQQKNIVELFPNPAKDVLNITISSSENVTVEIYNMSGQLVFSTISNKSLSFSTKEFCDGLYVLHVAGNTWQQSYNFCIVR